MKTAAGICWYQDHLITRTLESIKGKFDYIFVIDGRYELNPSKNDYSDPNLRKIVSENAILTDFVGHEEDKRDQYLIQCKKYDVDVLFIIDSDEYVNESKTDWDKFWDNIKPLQEGIYGILCLPNDIYLPRIWIKPYNFRYYGAHCIFQNLSTGDITTSGQASKSNIDGLVMQMGKDEARLPEYLENTRVYQEKMIEKEKPIRKSITP